MNVNCFSEWYEQSATMMGEEGAVIGGLLVGLNVIDCTICIKGGDLDVQVCPYVIYQIGSKPRLHTFSNNHPVI
jgi:hypothetical protein